MKYNALPENTRHGVKRLLMDYLGVGSRREARPRAAGGARVREEPGREGRFAVIGDSARVNMTAPRFANAISVAQPGAGRHRRAGPFPLQPAGVFGRARRREEAGASGRDLVVALAAGCEMMERREPRSESVVANRGYHTTPNAGVFGPP
jgi:hypothetical protein